MKHLPREAYHVGQKIIVTKTEVRTKGKPGVRLNKGAIGTVTDPQCWGQGKEYIGATFIDDHPNSFAKGKSHGWAALVSHVAPYEEDTKWRKDFTNLD